MRLVGLTWLLLSGGCNYDPQPSAVDAVEAPAVDAAFERGMCPATYNLQPAGFTTAYRIEIDTERTFVDSDLDCRDDSGGLTHLATVADATELAMLRAELNKLPTNLPDGNWWIGGIQLRDQATPATGWLSFAGGLLFDGWQPGEPNDTGDGEDNEENFAMISRNRDFVDDQGTHLAICECDGVPIDPATQAALDAAQ